MNDINQVINEAMTRAQIGFAILVIAVSLFYYFFVELPPRSKKPTRSKNK